MKIFTIALNTFKEAVRDKVLYSLIFFAVLMIGLSSIIDRITVGQQDKIIKDMGLASLSIFGVMIAIFVGIGLVFKEIDKRTIYSIISKPIARWQFLVGKYVGLMITLLVEVLVMTAGLYVFLFAMATHVDPALLKAIGLIYVELCLVTAVALLFSSFSTPFLSGIFTLSIFIIGHLMSDLKAFSDRKLEAAQKMIVDILYFVLPNLEFLNIKGLVVHGQAISWLEVGQRAVYGTLYAFMLLFFAVLIFQRREFK